MAHHEDLFCTYGVHDYICSLCSVELTVHVYSDCKHILNLYW